MYAGFVEYIYLRKKKIGFCCIIEINHLIFNSLNNKIVFGY